MASAAQQYVDTYAEAAMEQQRRHGIPASVTLAQGILESGNGRSQLSRECNNHFGIKASRAWLAAGGAFGLYNDDRPNEKFCKYASVSDSYEHHSLVLKQSDRYADCFQLEPTDYKGWCRGLQAAGYATDRQYANSLISVIERMDLDKYDRMAGTQTDSIRDAAVSYSFPLKRQEFMLVTSAFGNRKDPMNPNAFQFHRGIDIKCNGEQVLATEDGGRVVKVSNRTDTAGGKSVTVEYRRDDGTKYQTTCRHLESIAVREGDDVKAGQTLGVSGNTGTRTTGPHLHFEVRQFNADGSSRNIDPAAYLAETSAKGDIRIGAQHNGHNLLAKYATGDSPQASPELNPEMGPEEWMKKLLSSEDSGVSLPSSDPVTELAISMYTGLLALAMQIDGKTDSEAMAAATDAAANRQLDLTALAPGTKSCVMHIREGRSPLLAVTTANGSFSHELTNAETARLSATLNDSRLSREVRQQRVAAVIGNIVLAEQASLNYNAQIGRDHTAALQR